MTLIAFAVNDWSAQLYILPDNRKQCCGEHSVRMLPAIAPYLIGVIAVVLGIWLYQVGLMFYFRPGCLYSQIHGKFRAIN